MFSVIIAIVSIALIAVLVIASILYLKNPTAESFAAAEGARYIQEGGQLMGAVELYKTQNYGALPSGTNEEIKQELLDGKYLKAWPNEKWGFTSDYAIRGEVSEDACVAINKKLGAPYSPLPSCTDEAFMSQSVCCSLPEEPEST